MKRKRIVLGLGVYQFISLLVCWFIMFNYFNLMD